MRSDLLFLAHRIPYPPNKGDKIRSFHILRHLSSRFRVHVGAFVDDADDWRHVDAVAALCASYKLVNLDKRLALLRSIVGFANQEALGLAYYRDAELRAWVRNIAERHPLQAVFVFSSTMAQYADGVQANAKVLDLCDVDSEKWQQYADARRFPMRWLYRRESRRLAAEERKLASQFDALTLVSGAEAGLFNKVAPAAKSRTHVVGNGVDIEYFDPAQSFANPFGTGEIPLVFTGAMDYWANVDAVRWFADEVLPRIVDRHAGARFYIVGSRPADSVRALGARPGIVVTGSVADIRPYLSHARLVVAPLRIARGIQNKVLEALAMSRPLVATTAALDGLEGVAVAGAAAADTGEDFADRVCEALRSAAASNEAGRAYVRQRFGWEANLAVLDALLTAKRVGAA